MITVKGTQQTEDEAPSRERYLFADAEKYSKFPLAVMLLIGAIVAYIKTAVSPGQAALPDETDMPTSDQNAGRKQVAVPPPLADIAEAGDGAAQRPATDAEDGVPPARRLASNSSVVLFPIYDMTPMDSPIIDYQPIEPVQRAPMSFSALSTMISVNDNFTLPGRPSRTTSPPPGGNDGPDDEPGPVLPRRNRAPTSTGPVKLNDVFAGQAALFVLADLLLNSRDADGDILRVSNVSASLGTLGMYRGDLSYFADRPMSGKVTLSYVVSDGEFGVWQTAYFYVVRPQVIFGSEDDDLIVGTLFDDEIDGLGGHDLIDARDGNDIISGGAGDDHIVAGDGNDIVYGGAGDDVVFAGNGNDIVFGGDGADKLFGEAGDDVLHGDAGSDTLDGGTGDDLLDGGAGDDELSGGDGDDGLQGGDGDDLLLADAGNDRAFGGDGDDVISGGDGNDVIDGEAGGDTLLGGTGNDYILGGEGDDSIEGNDGDDIIDAGPGADTVDAGDGNDFVTVSIDVDDDAYNGGRGRDRLDLSLTSLGVEIDLHRGKIEGIEIGRDTITGFEQVRGGRGDDNFIVGGNAATILEGGDGDDTFTFRAAAGDTPSVATIIHEIIDIMVGDRILVDDFEITELQKESAEDRFARAYEGRDENDNPFPIRVRFERYDNVDHTIIDVDFDRNHDYELSIDVYGTYRPFVYETA